MTQEGIRILHGREIRVSRTESYDRATAWSAIDDQTFDGAPDSNCNIGRGATPEEAIADLAEQEWLDTEWGSPEGETWLAIAIDHGADVGDA